MEPHPHQHHHRRRHREGDKDRRLSSRSRSPRREKDSKHRHHRRRHGHRSRDVTSSRRGSQDSSSVSSTVDTEPIRWADAANVLAGLVRVQPAVGKDLVLLLQMLDEGEGVVTDGVADPILPRRLAAPFLTLDCKETPGPDGTAYFARSHVRDAGCVLHLGAVLDVRSLSRGGPCNHRLTSCGPNPAYVADQVGRSDESRVAVVASSGCSDWPESDLLGFDAERRRCSPG